MSVKSRVTCGILAVAVIGVSSVLVAQSESAKATETYKVDPVHSSVVFRINHAGASNFYGMFNEINGQFTVNPANPDEVRFDLWIKSDSLDTRNDMRDNHLKGNEFFDVKKHPTIAFKSTKVAAAGGKTYDVSGDLSLLGVTKPITARVEFIGEGDFHGHRAGYDASFTINRSDFGMNTFIKEGTLGDEVKLMIGLEGVQQ